jgi:transposase
MLHLSSQCRYYLYEGHADMRKGFDGLCGLVLAGMRRKIMMGDVFVFINRPATHIKLLQWEGDGFALYYKRLERGTFERPAGVGVPFFRSVCKFSFRVITLPALFNF